MTTTTIDTLFAGANQHNALRLLIASAVAIAAAYASCFLPGGAPTWAGWLLALGTATIMVAAMMLGAVRDAQHGAARLLLPFLFTWLVVFGGFAAALLLPAESARDALWLGLPRRAAIIIYGIGILPILVLPLAYARTFDELTLSASELQRVRDAAAELQAQRAPTDHAQ